MRADDVLTAVPYRDEFTGLRDYRAAIAQPPAPRRPLRWMLIVFVFALGFLCGAASVYAAEPPCVRLKVRPAVMLANPWAKYDITAEIYVRRHVDHRALYIEWTRDGLHDGSSGPRDLDGARAPFLHTLGPLRDKPGAQYEFIATVFDQRGKVVGRDRAHIRTPEASPE